MRATFSWQIHSTTGSSSYLASTGARCGPSGRRATASGSSSAPARSRCHVRPVTWWRATVTSTRWSSSGKTAHSCGRRGRRPTGRGWRGRSALRSWIMGRYLWGTGGAASTCSRSTARPCACSAGRGGPRGSSCCPRPSPLCTPTSPWRTACWAGSATSAPRAALFAAWSSRSTIRTLRAVSVAYMTTSPSGRLGILWSRLRARRGPRTWCGSSRRRGRCC
mmetsp:Transcript_19500/g.47829  ORF Transcript_19500/g.47829 Transcript_19500/m.47829 type:complete len:221 (+) Transcript_19500:196-858(+)